MRRKTIGSISLAAIIATAPVAAFAATSSTGEYGQWGLDMSDQRNGALNCSYTYDATGAGVRVYVVDTGIDAGHGDLGGRVVGGYNAVDGSGSTADCNGHGTHMAGLVAGRGYGIAKGATLVPVRVQACDYTSSTQRYVAGIDWMVANHQAGTPAVANMSFDENPSAELDAAVQRAIDDGITVVVAAGNANEGHGSDNCAVSPARNANTVRVGGV